MQRLVRTLTLFALVACATTAPAASVPWDQGVPLVIHAGVENPLVLFGFNPQPEPPPHALVSETIFDPTAVTRSLSGIEPTPFVVGLAGQGRFLAPPEPGVDFDIIDIGFVTAGGQDLVMRLHFTPRGDGDLSSGISDPLFFNPQPEPPPLYAHGLGFQFAFDDLAGIGTVAVGLEVFDGAGSPLAISAVPLPPAAGLLLAGLGAVVGAGRARRCAAA